MPVLTNDTTPDAAPDTSAPVPTTPPADTTGTNGRNRRPWLIAGAVLLAVGAAAGVLVTTSGDGDDATAEPVTLRAVEATVSDLVEFSELDGTLTWADQQTLTAANAGLVTEIVPTGSTVTRGDVAYELDAVPTTVFYGDLGLYRPLAEGDTGDDVAILEANLAALGHHTSLDDDGNEIDTGFVVDGVFDSATAEAVEAWQAELGVAETGVVQPTDVVVVPGPSLVTDASVERGDRVATGAPLVTLTLGSSVATGHTAHDGEIDVVVTAGSEIRSGDVVYTVDEQPVIALLVEDPAEFDRDLVDGIADGDDIAVVEQMLSDLGYDAGGDLEVDDEFEAATAEAIEDWEDDLADRYDEFDADGGIDLDDLWIVAADGPITVGTITTHDADVTASGSEFFSTTDGAIGRIVSTEIDVAEQDKLALGTIVDVELPDGSTVPGEVTDVATSSSVDPMDPTAEPTLAVEITVGELPEAYATSNELDVDIQIVEDLAAGATIVPASALISLGDGTYVVEVPFADGTTQFVPVEPGMFADGDVEVTGIEPGTPVVVPS